MDRFVHRMEVKVEAKLPQVLEEEVQLRLPAKSLVRFKSVCKRWRSRFESRPFIDLYAQRRPRGPFNSFSSESRTSDDQELREMCPGLNQWQDSVGCGFWSRDYRVLGPLSNGIYCVISHNILIQCGNGTCPVLSAKIAMCNPATRQHEFAQRFPYEFRDMLSETSPPDPTLPPSQLFFGFGSVCKKINDGSETLDYRAVVIIHYGTKMPYSFLVFVYSFLRRKWRQIVDYRAGRKKIGKPKALAGFDLPQGRRIIGILDPSEPCPQGFLKGCYHWIVVHQDHSYSVLAFNFADQSFKLLGVPSNPMDIVVDEGVHVTECSCSLVLHDHLALIRYFAVPASSSSMRTVEIGVWMMMEYGVKESWTRIYTVNPDSSFLLNSIRGIDYEEDPCANEGSGGVCIKGLLLKIEHDDVEEIVYCDNNGGHQVITSTAAGKPLYDLKLADDLVVSVGSTGGSGVFSISWSSPGISTYIESLEPLCAPLVSSEKSDKIGRSPRGGRLAERLRKARTRMVRVRTL